MRQPERMPVDIELPGRYTLDEARFPGGSERMRNREVKSHEPTADIT